MPAASRGALAATAGAMSRVLVILALAVGLVACVVERDPGGAADAGASPYPSDLIDLVDQSGWIFEGTVEALHASTEPSTASWDPSTLIVVRTDAVSVFPLEADLLIGSRNTILLNAPPEGSLDVGARAYFFVTAQVIGTSYVFREVGHVDADAVPFDRLHADVHAVARYLLDRALSDRLRAAARVIIASVIDAEVPADPGCDSCPIPAVATLAPRDTLSGPAGTTAIDPVVVHYHQPNGPVPGMILDPEDDQAVYLLQPSSDGPTLTPDDRRPMVELPRIRSLIASPPVPPAF
jgi:hypothetical protein